MNEHFDYAVIGAGMAGSAIAAHLAEQSSVVLLETEDQPGYHATGRSAAVLADFYGNAVIQAITRASRPFFLAPPSGFTAGQLVNPRLLLMIAAPGDEATLQSFVAALPEGSGNAISVERAIELCPILRRDQLGSAALVTTIADIEVHELQQGYLRLFRSRGGVIQQSAQVSALQRIGNGWRLTTSNGGIDCTVVVNAAGAWADEVGAMAGAQRIGLQSYRRTALLIDPPAGSAIGEWPVLFDVNEAFYLKPDAGMLLLSPADEGISDPCDAQPEDLDIAIAVDKIERTTTLEVKRIPHRWAGLRSFVEDRSPVVGYDGQVPDFFWMAALGGYGIQTAPELSRVAAALARKEDVTTLGYDTDELSPIRLG
ncbi:FAD-binding oxidoreductase [Sphingomonas sp. UV9]|uniref:NAD(P)/FAD-dependent oxidoreductase n=1 Tax=Sphingomonas sp. UV9 TaxID=1851410 RepID=UPI000FFB6E51|nr:FAD-binding oxidoreductase [Sphingomonas sp. UV9]RXD04828.1 FAD-binding oxidoreductase [Sphingomonas sp. UV9]